MKKFYQKAFLLLITLLIFFTASPSLGFSSAAAVKETYLTVDEAMEWLDSTVGTKRGDGQCIAFIKDYYEVLTGSAPRGDAADFAYNTLPEGFGWKRIKGEKNLKKGDILIWTGGTGGNGHAAIYGGDGKYYHQKWRGMYVEIIGKAYLEGFPIRRSGSFAYYWGVIRPTFRSKSLSAPPSDCNYRLRNAGTGKYLTADSSSEITARRLRGTDSESQLFTFDETKTGFNLSPCSSSKVVGVDFEEEKTANDADISLFKSGKRDYCKWKIQKIREAYIIRNVYDPTLCLATDKKGNLTVETYKGSKTQKWKSETVNMVVYDGNGGLSAPKTTAVEAGDTHKITAETPDRVGYKFLGWAETKNAKKATLKSGSEISPDENITLYAVWKKNDKYEIKSAELSESKYIYDGKVKTPSVTVKDTNGNTLCEETDYTLSYSKGRKRVGEYSVTVTYTGKFSGTDTLYFTVERE